MYKAFETHKTNGMKLHFKNGNSMSVIWGASTDTDNYFIPYIWDVEQFLS
jgi:hypothetical protein